MGIPGEDGGVDADDEFVIDDDAKHHR